MIVKRAIMILLGLLLLMGPVTAYYADIFTFTPSDASKVWIIADTGQQNVIRLFAKNSTHGPIMNAPVTFTLDNALLGTISPLITSTDNNGEALCTFTVNSTHPTSGTARITADVIFTEDATGATYHTIMNWDQQIDHNVPYTAIFAYSNEVAVESVMPVKLSIFDRWDNRVDDKRPAPAHNLTLHVNGPSPPNDCGFTDYGRVHDIKKISLDSNGVVNVNITPATKPGWHYILMDSMGSIPEQMKMFNTVTSGDPCSMTQFFSPDTLTPLVSNATVPADGTSTFSFYYTLYDKYGNPTRNQTIWVNTSVPGEEQLRVSLENGQVWSTYGPKSFSGMYTINAVAVRNTSLHLSKYIQFVNTSPTNLGLSANPETMPSRDANPLIYSSVSAKVTDDSGNGAPREVVTFTLHGMTKSPVDANETKYASFDSSTTIPTLVPPVTTAQATSDAMGYATVNLYPSAYATKTEPGFKEAVTGSGLVTAAWTDPDGHVNQRDVKVTWKNYPYLSAIVAVNPQQVKVGDTVDVSIKLNGDGWALVPNPANVVLVTDLSGSMSNSDISPTRLGAAKTALKKFVGLSNGKIYLALVSYGNTNPAYSNEAQQLYNIQAASGTAKPFNPYGSFVDRAETKPSNWGTSTYQSNAYSDAKFDLNFTTDSNALNTTIDSAVYSANGGTCIGCGLSGALKEIQQKGYTGHNKTIIIMSDGVATMAPINSTFPLKSYMPSDWVSDKSTIGKQAAIAIATDIKAPGNDIKIYTIAFGSGADTTTLAAIASPGCAKVATDGAALNTVYQEIYGLVVTDASVNTVMNLDLGNLIINNAPITAGHYFDYVANKTTSPTSTMLDKYNLTHHLIPGINDTSGKPFDSIGPITIDQSDYWNDAAHQYQLKFNISTIKLKETWETNFRLKILVPGNIIIYSPLSTICFKNGLAGDSCMALPNLSISASLNPVNLGVNQTHLDVVGLTRTDDGPVKGTLPVTWTTIYTGNVTTFIITEDISYIRDADPPVRFDKKTLTATDLLSPQSSTLNTEKLPPGGYKIQVHAYTQDASVTKECGTYFFTTQGRAFIKLE